MKSSPNSGMIAFVDQPFTVERSGGVFMVTLRSGDDLQTFALTPHALLASIETARRAAAEALPKPLPFKRRV